jgi:hypothetical protein
MVVSFQRGAIPDVHEVITGAGQQVVVISSERFSAM